MPSHTTHPYATLIVLLALPTYACSTYSPVPYNPSNSALLSPEIHHINYAPLPETKRKRSAKKSPLKKRPKVSPSATSKPLSRTTRAKPAPKLKEVVRPAPKKIALALKHKTPQKAYNSCKKKKKISFARRAPKGALVFFHNTHDLNNDGRNNDWYTTTARVLSTANSSGTMILGIKGAQGKEVKVKLNLDYPDIHEQQGNIYNTAIRPQKSSDPPFTQYLAGQLFAGFCVL